MTANSSSTPTASPLWFRKNYSREAARQKGDNTATAMKSVVADPSVYDWEGDTPLHRPSSRTIIYEMHVRGFTRHASSGVAENKRGTFAGLIEKIPYLQELGITAVELMPVFQFDPQDAPPGLVNYWGYAPVSFFAAAPGIQLAPGPARPDGRVPRHGQGTASRRASRSFSTWSSTTPRKATIAGQR